VYAALAFGRERPDCRTGGTERRDTEGCLCPAVAQRVQMIPYVSSTGKVIMLTISLLNTQEFPYAKSGALYHQRCCI